LKIQTWWKSVRHERMLEKWAKKNKSGRIKMEEKNDFQNKNVDTKKTMKKCWKDWKNVKCIKSVLKNWNQPTHTPTTFYHFAQVAHSFLFKFSRIIVITLLRDRKTIKIKKVDFDKKK